MRNMNITDSPLLNEKEVAALLGVTVHALRRWRFEGRGPRFSRVEGRLVRYRPEDVESWLAAQPVGGGKEAA
jgi:predicted DNA-binding transcriptional regulator AlpA